MPALLYFSFVVVDWMLNFCVVDMGTKSWGLFEDNGL
jgi:hypothetical protein